MSTKSARRRRAASRRATTPTDHGPRPRLSLVKTPPPLPVRPATVAGPDAYYAEIAHAAMAATARRIPARVTGWHPEDGRIVQRTDYRTLLQHSGRVDDAFTALILCRQGAEHVTRIINAAHLEAARRAADDCTIRHADLGSLCEPVPATARALYGRRIAVLTLHQKGRHAGGH